MAVEIERKFLVDVNALPDLGQGLYISQGYIETTGKTTVRARVKGNKGFITLKGESVGMSRLEFEYEIPAAEAREIISLLCAGKSVEKTRYEYKVLNHIWEIDFFSGENEGLIVAEVELSDEAEQVIMPQWVTEEVTGQVKYYNVNLINNPYSKW
jgi:adenylate cyclase